MYLGFQKQLWINGPFGRNNYYKFDYKPDFKNVGKINHFRADQLLKILSKKYQSYYFKQFNLYKIPKSAILYELDGFYNFPEKHYNNLIIDSILVNGTNVSPIYINILRTNGQDIFLQNLYKYYLLTNNQNIMINKIIQQKFFSYNYPFIISIN